MLRQTCSRFLRASIPKNTVKFSNFVQEEIALEKEQLIPIDLKPMQSLDWKVNVSGAEVEMSKDTPAVNYSVHFSVNGSVPPMNETEEEQEPVSYPDFSIAIEKSNYSNVLEFECFFPGDDVSNYQIRAAT